MADERDDSERTQDPTPKRLDEAIKRGDVVKSIEVSTWFRPAIRRSSARAWVSVSGSGKLR